ncbi:protein-disulfide isomerase [Aneurinibacillus soli]|uniref:Disulfide bond formation protein D n=1 Tax=Aneurinibacillus soli TaxID=1500254 RepID=A0A0U5B322_9BACL|nr:thioredoxin domain-containing protein [Aneurinibacillus soli]PYE62092.1 protein-disulfide isomerase [Aneurinibacillus soli]BAU28720.1 Disulfide bond formation protein D precursor [Aneurinibacillus soli]
MGNKDAENKNRRKMEKMVLWTLAFVLVVVVAFVSMNAFYKSRVSATVDEAEFQYKKQPTIGSASAPVNMVEFADFKCPACKQFAESIMPRLQKDFIDSGVVQLHFINYPVISPKADSTTAAMAGEAIYKQNPAEFWRFYKVVYAEQRDEGTNWATADFLVQLAQKSNLHVNYQQLKKDIENNTFAEDVKNDKAIVTKIGIHSTPTVYINGKKLSDDATFDYAAIKAEILKSQGESKK